MTFAQWGACCVVAASAVLCASCGGDVEGGSGGAGAGNQVKIFAKTVQPILDRNCYCHTPGSAAASSSGLVLKDASDSTYASITGHPTAVQPGDHGKSALYTSISERGMRFGVTDEEMAVVAAWIDAGAQKYGPGEGLGGDEVEPSATLVGVRVCTNCHAGQTLQWVAGAHGNLQAVDHTTLAVRDVGFEGDGFPFYGLEGLGNSPDCTAACHDPLGDGQRLTEEWTGNVPRPVVGCESCHGEGSLHYGKGPVAFPKPDHGRCGQCHDQAVPADCYHSEGAGGIVEKYVASPHAKSVNEHTRTAEGSRDVRARCSKCHTDEGAKRYRDVEGGRDALEAGLPDTLPPVAGAARVQCRTCHNAHAPGKLLLSARRDAAGAIVESEEYRTCAGCHQPSDGYHGEKSARSWSLSVLGQGTFDPARVIYDTHSDNPGTPEIEGYVLDPSGERVCSKCHDVHAADLAIPRQWARSAHGGFLLNVKDEASAKSYAPGELEEGRLPAAVTAGVLDGEAAAWAHYDFKTEDRRACQRCHTTTGFVNFASAPAAYDPARNVFAAQGQQKELLYCYGCHAGNAGALRKPGAITLAYAADAPYAYPDVAGSNLCLACHTGMQSGAAIQASRGDFSDMAFASSHYLAAGGVLFAATGYEYDADGDPETDDYAPPAPFTHDKVGTAEAPGTGSNGPCVACHFSGPESHLLLPLERTAAGEVAGVRSQVCGQCHKPTAEGDFTLLPAAVEAKEKAYQQALQALQDRLAARAFFYYSSYPYFLDQSGLDPSASDFRNHATRNWLTDPNDDGTKDPDTGKPNLGAAFNLALLRHEPGAYAHNALYAKRLVFDAIDWLDDASLDRVIDLSGYPGAAAWLRGDNAGNDGAVTRPAQ